MIENIKRILKHTLNYGFATILTNIISLCLIPMYTNFLTPTEYAIVDLVTTLNNILIVILVFGLNASLTIFYYHSENEDDISSYYSTIFNFLFIISGLILGIFMIYNNIIGITVIKNVPPKYVNYLLVTCGFSLFLQFPMSVLQMREKSKTYGLVSVAQFTITTTLSIIFVALLKQNALGVLRANLISSGIFFVIAMILSRDLYKFNINFYKLREMLKVGFPVIPHQLAGWGLTFADRIILNQFVNLNELGIYSFAYKVGMIMGVITGSINQAWTPFFMETAKKKGEEAKVIFSKINKYYFIIIGFICFLLSLYSKELVIIMAPLSYRKSENIVPLILISYLLNGLYFMIVNSIFYTKKTFYLPISTICSVLINIGVNYMLVPHYGIYGAAIANLIAFTVLFLVVYIVNLKIYGIKMPFLDIFKGGSLFILSYIFISKLVNYSIIANIILKGAFSLLTLTLVYNICLNKQEKSNFIKLIDSSFNKVKRKLSI